MLDIEIWIMNYAFTLTVFYFKQSINIIQIISSLVSKFYFCSIVFKNQTWWHWKIIFKKTKLKAKYKQPDHTYSFYKIKMGLNKSEHYKPRVVNYKNAIQVLKSNESYPCSMKSGLYKFHAVILSLFLFFYWSDWQLWLHAFFFFLPFTTDHFLWLGYLLFS